MVQAGRGFDAEKRGEGLGGHRSNLEKGETGYRPIWVRGITLNIFMVLLNEFFKDIKDTTAKRSHCSCYIAEGKIEPACLSVQVGNDVFVTTLNKIYIQI